MSYQANPFASYSYHRPAGSSHWTPRRSEQAEKQKQCIVDLFRFSAFQEAMQQNNIDPTRVTSIKAATDHNGRPVFTVINQDKTETPIYLSDIHDTTTQAVNHAHSFLTGQTNQLPVYPPPAVEHAISESESAPQAPAPLQQAALIPSPHVPQQPQQIAPPIPAAAPSIPAADWPQAMIATLKEVGAVMREFKEMQMATVAANARTAEYTVDSQTATIERIVQANHKAAETATKEHRQSVESLTAALTHTTDAHIRAANAAGREHTAQMQIMFDALHRPNKKDLESYELTKELLKETQGLRLQVNDLSELANNVTVGPSDSSMPRRMPPSAPRYRPSSEDGNAPPSTMPGPTPEQFAELYASLRF